MRSARWQSIADLPIVAHRGLRHHRGIAREQCPSSSAVARHFTNRARYHALPAAAPASRMILASCGSPGREPRNPARDVGPEILVLRSEPMNENRLLVPHDKRVEGEPHQHTVQKKA